MKFKIDKDLFKLKMLYFFGLSFYSVIVIYLSPFMIEWGITVTELAIINSITHIATFFSRPIFGYIADRNRNYKMTIIFISLACSIAFLLNLACPKLKQEVLNYSLIDNLTISKVSNNELSVCYVNATSDICWPSFMENCFINSAETGNLTSSETNSSCSIIRISGKNYTFQDSDFLFSSRKCLNIYQNCSGIRLFIKPHKRILLTWSLTFWILAFLKIVTITVYSPISNLADSLTFLTLGKERSNKYGFTRMFGTIGVLVFSIITGFLMFALDWLALSYKWNWLVRLQEFSKFTICFIMQIIIFCVVIIIVIFIKDIKSDQKKKTNKKSSCMSNFLEIMSIKMIFKNWETSLFFIFTILGGFILTIHAEYYIIIVYKMFPSAPKMLPGILVAIMTLSESIFFGISEKVLKWFSYEFWVSISYVMWFFRWLGYNFGNKYWMFLIIDALHGPTFALQITSLISFIGKAASHSKQGRIQGLFSGLYFNIGGCLGGFFGGIIIDNLGINSLFKIMSGVSLLLGLLYYPLQVFIIRRHCKSVVEGENIEIDFNTEKLIPDA